MAFTRSLILAARLQCVLESDLASLSLAAVHFAGDSIQVFHGNQWLTHADIPMPSSSCYA